MMKETKELVFKSSLSNSFLKTVSAFSNFGDGTIIFGVNDDGSICGIDNMTQICLDIENKIKDNITPKPNFNLQVDEEQKIIYLNVQEGSHKPYFYKGKAYRRSDTSSVEVDFVELRSLVMEGEHLSFEELRAPENEFEFSALAGKLKEKLNVSEVTNDVLRTLGFYTREGYLNNVAGLCADKNSFYGIDCARFGKTMNIILDRETISNVSVFTQYDKAVQLIKKYYQYEEIKGIDRQIIQLIPEEAYREAIANAIVHRDWNIPSHIRILMFEDKIEIISPGALPNELSAFEYENGKISRLNNPILGNLFYRLRYIEMFGTGIARIKEAYEHANVKPKFEVSEHSISVTLPVLTNREALNSDESLIYDILCRAKELSSSQIVAQSHFTKSKALRVLESLKEKNYIETIGNGRSTKYKTI